MVVVVLLLHNVGKVGVGSNHNGVHCYSIWVSWTDGPPPQWDRLVGRTQGGVPREVGRRHPVVTPLVVMPPEVTPPEVTFHLGAIWASSRLDSPVEYLVGVMRRVDRGVMCAWCHEWWSPHQHLVWGLWGLCQYFCPPHCSWRYLSWWQWW